MTGAPPPERRHPVAAVLAAGAAIVLFGLPAAAAPAQPEPAEPSPPSTPSPPSSPSPTGPAGGGDLGRSLYLRTCAFCHGVAGEGSVRGPALVGVGAASVDFQLSTGRMPLAEERADPSRGEPAFSPDEIAALVRYVTGFGGGGPPIPRVGAGNLGTGRELYLATCAACHSSTGAGGTLTNGRSAPPLYRATRIQVAEAVRVGPGLMPAFPHEVLDEQEVDSIVAYVDALQGERGPVDPGGWALGRLGPFSEGAVGLLIGVGLLVLVARWLGSRAGE